MNEDELKTKMRKCKINMSSMSTVDLIIIKDVIDDELFERGY